MDQSSLRLPRGEVVYYNTGRPNIRVLTRDIRALYYDVWVLHLDRFGFQQQEQEIPQRAWLRAILINRAILLISAPEEDEQSASTASDQDNEGSESNEGSSEVYDSDNVDPDAPERGYLSYRGANYGR
jgi:hypothetical protein